MSWWHRKDGTKMWLSMEDMDEITKLKERAHYDQLHREYCYVTGVGIKEEKGDKWVVVDDEILIDNE